MPQRIPVKASGGGNDLMARKKRRWNKALAMVKNPTRSPGSKAIEITRAAKIEGCSATYISQTTCSPRCAFLNNGCYGESGPVSWNRPDKAREIDPKEVADQEVRQIKQLSGMRPLRLHVIGDAADEDHARKLAEAAEIFSSKADMPVFTFTHNWREIPKEAWGDISVLASCETTKDGLLAEKLGYAVAIVRPDKPGRPNLDKETRELPCVHETRGRSCLQCGLCMDAEHLFSQRIWIRFTAHGARKNVAANQLRRIQ